jgi:hypothetical protein
MSGAPPRAAAPKHHHWRRSSTRGGAVPYGLYERRAVTPQCAVTPLEAAISVVVTDDQHRSGGFGVGAQLIIKRTRGGPSLRMEGMHDVSSIFKP